MDRILGKLIQDRDEMFLKHREGWEELQARKERLNAARNNIYDMLMSRLRRQVGVSLTKTWKCELIKF